MSQAADADRARAVEVLLEVQPRSISGDLTSRPALPEEFRRRAGEIADSVAEVADQFRLRLEGLLTPVTTGWGVETIEIGFDIAVQAEAGVVIAKAKTGATFSARLTLKASSDDQ